MGAEENAAKIMEQHGKEIRGFLREGQAAIQAKAPTKWKMIKLKEITGRFSTLISSVTPCGQGCSHCCNQAVVVTYTEAVAIADYTKKGLNRYVGGTIHQYHAKEDNRIKKYSGTPCPFLVDKKCGIYEVRPVMCRTYHVVEDTNEKCVITDAKDMHTIGQIDVSKFFLAYVDMAHEKGAQYADIREWFEQA